MTFADLFSGLGGFRIAFEKNKCKCVFSSEIDEKVIEVYKRNFNDNSKCDITKKNIDEIPNFDILCAGFPCQPFSLAGRRLGFEDSRGTLFFNVANILRQKRPKAFILENVRGITNHDGGRTLKTILGTLDELGYNYKYNVLNAKEYGIPQHRERWYCIGIRKDINTNINLFNFPRKCNLKFKVKDIIEKEVSKIYNVTDICKKNILKFVDEKHIEVDDWTLAYEVRASRCQFKNDGISPCLTAKMGTGGNNIPVLVKEMRHLTEKECLKLMGYPDWYDIGKGMATYKQIGNSVVVPIIEALATELVRIIN